MWCGCLALRKTQQKKVTKKAAQNAIGVLDEKPVWVWHVGLVTDAKRFINADAFAGQVIEVDLRDYLEQHANAYAGVIVTRMAQRPSPQRCRRHAPMQAPKLPADRVVPNIDP
jgi:hypothetical protein